MGTIYDKIVIENPNKRQMEIKEIFMKFYRVAQKSNPLSLIIIKSKKIHRYGYIFFINFDYK